MNNIFALSGLSIGVTCFTLLFIIISYGKTKLHRIWCFFNLAVFIWGIGTFIAGNTIIPSQAFIGWQIGLGCGVFISVFFYHTVCVFCGINRKWFLVSFYFAGLLYAVLIWLKRIIILPDPRFFFNSVYYPQGTIFYLIPLIIWTVIVSLSYYELFIFLKKSTGVKRTQASYLFFGALIGFLGGTSVHLPIIGIPLYPIGNFGVALYAIIGTYAILRHQLLEIEVVIKKTVVFAGMFAFVYGVVVVVATIVAQLLGGVNNLLSLAISSFIIILLLRPTEKWLINATDKFLFQKKYEYKQIIKTFIDEIITELNLDEVVNSTLKLLGQTLHPHTAAIFILNKVEDKYQLYNAYGLEDKNIVFTSESKLVSFLKKSHDPAVIKQVDGIAGVNPEIQKEMAGLKAVICLPLLLHSDLIGFISLGRKKSDEEYTKDDLDVLSDLARTETVAVANSQLLAEAAQAERRAVIGTMSAGINHEIGNPLNIMATRIQLFKLTRQKGLFKDKPVDEVLDQAEAALDECLKQSTRISEITKKLANFAKPSKEFKPVLVNISQEIDETLGIVGHDLELEKIRIEKNIFQDLPGILADRHEIQQIFFNIIRNAGQAIEETGVITIKAFLTSDGKVRIEIQDTGKGIPEDKKHRIFEPFFTTKAPNKGTGLGLLIVRQLVWKNKGEISFISQAGAGTTFILEFPRG